LVLYIEKERESELRTLSSFLVLRLIPGSLIPEMSLVSTCPSMPMYKHIYNGELWKMNSVEEWRESVNWPGNTPVRWGPLQGALAWDLLLLLLHHRTVHAQGFVWALTSHWSEMFQCFSLRHLSLLFNLFNHINNNNNNNNNFKNIITGRPQIKTLFLLRRRL